MKWKLFFILCLLMAGCTPLAHLPGSLPHRFHLMKPEETGLPFQTPLSENRDINRMITVQSATTTERPIALSPNAGYRTLASDATCLRTDNVKEIPNHTSVKRKAVDYVNKNAHFAVVNNAADADVILIVAVIVIIILAFLTGGTLLLVAGLAEPTWWMIILAGVLFYMGICCLLGFIGLAFGSRQRPSEKYNFGK